MTAQVPESATIPSSSATYIHGVSLAEQARLAELNRLTNAPFVAFLAVPAGSRVLEVGSGLGILARAVVESAPAVSLVGVEQSAEQIAAAAGHPALRYIQGDAQQLPLDDASFDLAYARYVLEHVADPVRVLREMRRVVRPGGYVVAQENDNSLQRLDPPCPLFERAWQAFMALQGDIGGDSFIGRKLFRLFKSAGFTQIELSVQPELHWAGSPGFRSWVSNLAGNLESGREALLARGACSAAELTGAFAELEAFAERTDASTSFVWNRARAIRDA